MSYCSQNIPHEKASFPHYFFLKSRLPRQKTNYQYKQKNKMLAYMCIGMFVCMWLLFLSYTSNTLINIYAVNNSQKLETTQMSTEWWIDKQSVVYP